MEFTFPSSWNELDRKGLLYVADKWQSWTYMIKSGVSLQRAKALLFIALLKGRATDKYRLTDYLPHINNEKLYECTQLANFLFDAPGLTKNLLPTIRIGFRKLHGPSDFLSNCCIGEFNAAMASFNRYNVTNDEKDLDLFILSLYRPRRLAIHTDGDKRQPFALAAVSRYKKQLLKVDFATKIAVWLYFYGCMEALCARYPEVFENKGSAKTRDFGWTSVILGLAGDKFGSFDDTAKTNLHLIFISLVNLAEQNKKDKK